MQGCHTNKLLVLNHQIMICYLNLQMLLLHVLLKKMGKGSTEVVPHLHVAAISRVSLGTLRAHVIVLILHPFGEVIELAAGAEVIFRVRQRTGTSLTVCGGSPQRVAVVAWGATLAFLTWILDRGVSVYFGVYWNWGRGRSKVPS